MRFLATLALVPIFLALAGCGALPRLDPGTVFGTIPTIIENIAETGKIPSTGVPEIDDRVNAAIIKVQTAANKYCGFLPIASTAGGILAKIVDLYSGLPAASVIEGAIISAGQKICDIAKKPGASRKAVRSGAYGSFRGVSVKGHFTR